MKNKIDFNNYSKNYNELLQTQHKKFGDIAYYSEYKVNIIKSLRNTNKELKILEFGCGIGRNLPYLKDSFSNSSIYAYDISEDSLALAKKENPYVNFVSNLENYENFFDIILIAGVYHHIEPSQRDSVTKQLYKILNKNGFIIIFEHNPYNPITMKIVNTCEFDKDAVVIKKNELCNLFLKHKFTCQKSDYTLFFPPKLKKLNFLEKYFKWCPLGGQYYIVVTKC